MGDDISEAGDDAASDAFGDDWSLLEQDAVKFEHWVFGNVDI